MKHSVPGATQIGSIASHRAKQRALSADTSSASTHDLAMDEGRKEEDVGALNLRQLLLKRSNWFEERIVDAADHYGYGFVTPAMNRLFAHMPRKPVSISTLARRMAVSRQAVHQVVTEACRRGILELVLDESDARLRKVRFTEKGRTMKQSAALAVDEIEADLERRLGAEDFATLRRILESSW
jgi:DNA-binding MarR family transcriptional regulator